MDIIYIAQAVGVFVIFLLCFLCAVLPVKLVPRDGETSQRSARVLSLSNCLSGGVFLGTCFLQLIPFIEDKFDVLFYQAGVSLWYTCPVTQVTVVLGFFLVLLTEQVVRICQTNNEARKESLELKLPIPTMMATAGRNEADDTIDMDSEEECGEDRSMLQQPQVEGQELTKVGGKKLNGRTQPGNVHGTRSPGHGHSHGGHGHSHLSDIVRDDFGLRCLILLMALSVHSVFEGVALGLQDEMYKFIMLFLGVALHEILVAFAIGVNLAQQNLQVKTVMKLCVVFSSTIPVGMLVGMAMKGMTSIAGQVVSATVQGLTAGTFVYVTFLEILPAEINTRDGCLFKVLFMFIGFVIIACLKFGISEGDAGKYQKTLSSQLG